MNYPISGYLRINHVLELIPIGRSTWWRWVAEGKAPKPVKLGPGTTAWKVSDISQLIADLELEGGVKMSLRKDNMVMDLAVVLNTLLDEIQEIRRSRRDCFTPIFSDEIDHLMLQLKRVIEILQEESGDHE